MKNTFLGLGISRDFNNILKESGIKEPTPIQRQTIPALLNGKDVIGQAHTGTGKTLAFLLPMMEKIDINKSYTQGLVITPTRELAIQITTEAKKLAPVKQINILAAYGGQDVEKQIRKLKNTVHLVIATPGRLLDHLRRKTISLKQISMLVLDEGDQMLHMGFLNEVEEIIKNTSPHRQNMVFSATMPTEIRKLASKYMTNPQQIKVNTENITLKEIRQIAVETTDRGKQDVLCKFIDENNPFMAIIFCRTKRRASSLNQALQKKGYNADELHGDLSQAKRERVMGLFRKGQIQFLVATDVAARGLDVEGITHIFNYDIPQDIESYIHRIGRTGRAGETGIAVTFVTPKDQRDFIIMEKEIKMPIEKIKMDKKISNDIEQEIDEKRKKGKKRGQGRANNGRFKSR